MEYKMDSAQSGSYQTGIEYNKPNADNSSTTQSTINKDTLLDYDKISSTHFDLENEVEKRILSHIGDYIEEPFSIIESYFAGKHLECLVRHQIESYNHFINYQIQRTIQMFNPVKIHSENDYIPEKDCYLLDVEVSFENFKLYPPQIH